MVASLDETDEFFASETKRNPTAPMLRNRMIDGATADAIVYEDDAIVYEEDATILVKIHRAADGTEYFRIIAL